MHLTVLSQGAIQLLLPIRTAPAETDQVDGIPEAFRFREQSSFRSSASERLCVPRLGAVRDCSF